jgi:hypothetical protein
MPSLRFFSLSSSGYTGEIGGSNRWAALDCCEAHGEKATDTPSTECWAGYHHAKCMQDSRGQQARSCTLCTVTSDLSLSEVDMPALTSQGP